MGKIKKAIAGAGGAALAKVIVGIINSYFPDIDSAALEYLIFTLLTGGAVYASPKNDD